MRPELEELLLCAVQTAPSNTSSCALMRLKLVQLASSKTAVSDFLDKVAMDVGFTRWEALGIMDGWDECACIENPVCVGPHFKDSIPPGMMAQSEYEAGLALGRRAWESRPEAAETEDESR